MSERGRNIMVGLFVLLGLTVLGYLIVQFQSTVGIFSGSSDYYIEIRADRTAAVLPGQTIHMNGKPIGQIRSVELAEDPRDGVIITAAISQRYGIPEDIEEVSIYQGQMGPPIIQIIALKTHSAQMMDKTPGEVVARLRAKIAPGALSQVASLVKEVRPALKELGTALAKIGELAENLNAMLADPKAEGSEAPGDPGDPGVGRVNIRGLVGEFSQTLENINALIGDEENRENFKQSLVNFRQAGKDASEVMKELKSFAGKAQQTTSELQLQVRDVAQAIISNSEQISTLLGHLNRAAEQINKGEGTVGKLLYDPKLYEEMLFSSEQLNQAMRTLRTLLNKWNKEGLKVKW